MKKMMIAAVAAMGLAFAANAQITKPVVTNNVAGMSGMQLQSLSKAKITNSVNAFSEFNVSGTGRQDKNAYLLCYLSTMVYPQYLGIRANTTAKNYESSLHNDYTKFMSEFEKYTRPLLTSPEYKMIKETDNNGYDPEAVVISTPTAIYVVFRGTDRVATNVGFGGYDWGEWIGTDFDTRHYMSSDLGCKVHWGMYQSIRCNDFKDKLLNEIKAKGGASKKIWLTGHSLGGGQAQLFGLYMAKQGLKAQGIYVYASPHPGTQEFVDAIDAAYPGGKLQRFEFVSDPVTMLSFYSFGFRRAGIRNYYDDINTMRYNEPERSAAEALQLFPTIAGVGANAVAGFINETSSQRLKLDVFNILGSPMCYHHPLWYLQAAYNQLSTAQRVKMPTPLSIPDPNAEACDYLAVNRGKMANPLQQAGTVIAEAATAVANTIQEIAYQAGNIISNVTGTAITDDEYYIRSYAAPNNLYLNDDEGIVNGGGLRLTTAKHKVKIMRTGAGGYVIRFGTKTVEGWFGDETREYVLDSDREDAWDAQTSTIILWERNNAPVANANQRWLFIRLRDDKYIIKNLLSGKVLDANNSGINNTSCGVATRHSVNNDQTQIWVLEKA